MLSTLCRRRFIYNLMLMMALLLFLSLLREADGRGLDTVRLPDRNGKRCYWNCSDECDDWGVCAPKCSTDCFDLTG
ncbi:hypothetical protein CHS0354_014278 [Potamilus streckersoni]|uniref:Uncharacterized protein n=1 Tax=Potamilus streckersoni TaxID=2493646 RepID=A0AAE0VYC2_9BIVA|nr:hypothetical protein CHS0354_014278 [Potamilus streckersoni]